MMQVKGIFFDLGLTLVRTHREEHFREVLERDFQIHLPEERVALAYHLTDKVFMRHYPGVLGKPPETFFPWYLGLLCHTLGVSVDLLELSGKLKARQGGERGKWQAYPETIAVLSSLKREGYRVGLISNWDTSARQVLQDNGLTEWFDSVVVSSEVGISKPEPEIFHVALRETGLSPEESVYVGDNYYDDFVGAEGVGMKCYVINRFGRIGVEEISDCPLVTSIEDVARAIAQQRAV